MSLRDSSTERGVPGATGNLAVLSPLLLEPVEPAEQTLLTFKRFLMGIPQGATESYLFARVTAGKRMAAFYATYLLVAMVNGVLWAVAPGGPFFSNGRRGLHRTDRRRCREPRLRSRSSSGPFRGEG